LLGIFAKSTELLFVAIIFLAAGCRQEGIRVYDAPKEVRAARMPLPEGWEELPPNQMALGNYVVRGKNGAKAQITVSALPTSDELANVNRWRKQVSLEPITPEELGKQRESILVAGHSGTLFNIIGTAPDTGKGTRIISALANLGDSTWFFKMMGDDELVAAQKETFTSFVSSYPLPAHDHAGEASSASTDAPPTPPVAVNQAKPASVWKVPAGWTEQQPGAMQDAKFSAADGKAIVTLSILGSATGTLRANIDRWRGQIGLAPVADAELEKIATPLDLPDAKATIVDMTGSKQRMISIIVPRGDSTWFFKMMGEPDAVAAEKNRFIEFVKTTK
jgi:hypothetical protein